MLRHSMPSDRFVQGFFEALFWSEVDDGYGPADIDADDLATLEMSVRGFWAEHSEKWDDDNQAGYDLALSANGHGAGFFDGEDEQYHGNQEALQDAARSFGERHLYVGDDGQLYVAR